MADGSAATVPPVWLDPADLRILGAFRECGPTYHINVSRTLDEDIGYVSRRCRDLTAHDLLERRDRTYYALTDRGERLLRESRRGRVAVSGQD
ncbi:MAG: MarR family transcriptional regulator [Halobacteriaceae archaeon]